MNNVYENDEIKVFWDPSLCEHSGMCVRGDDNVFSPKRHPWILLKDAKAIEVAKIIDTCPSKALSYELKIHIVFEPDEYRSIAMIGNCIIGACEFEENGNVWNITHTIVRDAYKGRGIAKNLVESVIAEAIKNNKKVLPICSYAKKMMEGNNEYKNVLFMQ